MEEAGPEGKGGKKERKMEKEEERELFDVAGYRDFSISRRSTEFDRCLHDFTSSPSLLPYSLPHSFSPWSPLVACHNAHTG